MSEEKKVQFACRFDIVMRKKVSLCDNWDPLYTVMIIFVIPSLFLLIILTYIVGLPYYVIQLADLVNKQGYFFESLIYTVAFQLGLAIFSPVLVLMEFLGTTLLVSNETWKPFIKGVLQVVTMFYSVFLVYGELQLYGIENYIINFKIAFNYAITILILLYIALALFNVVRNDRNKLDSLELYTLVVGQITFIVSYTITALIALFLIKYGF